jgi:hypothetical protein
LKKETIMDTTVITVEPADYGVGATDRVTLVDSKFTVDERGDLYVYCGDGNVGAFPHGSWRAVLRGTITTEAAGLWTVTR